MSRGECDARKRFLLITDKSGREVSRRSGVAYRRSVCSAESRRQFRMKKKPGQLASIVAVLLLAAQLGACAPGRRGGRW
jgi:hypothetical protein